MPGPIVGITGHRPDKLGGWNPCPEWDLVQLNIRNTLIMLQPWVFLSGMALGVDQWAAEIALQLGIPFVAFVPYPDFGSNWPRKAQVKFKWLLSQAQQVVYVVEEKGYAPWKLHRRNQWLVDQCELLLAVYNGSPGGTQSCLEYAFEKGRTVSYIPIGVPPPTLQTLMSTAPIVQQIQQLVNQAQSAPQEPQRTEVVRPRVRRIIEE